MTKTNGLWKRLGALLLAFALVVSMFPVQASAAETETLIPLELQLQRVDWQAKWDAAKNGDIAVWDADLLGLIPDERPAMQYIYIAVAPRVKSAGDVKFYWCKDTTHTDENGKVIYDTTAVAEKDVLVSSAGEGFARTTFQSNSLLGVSMKIICDGLVLTNTLATTEDVKTYTWEGKTKDWNGELKYGVPVKLGEFILDGVSGVDSADVNPVDRWNTAYVTEDGIPVKVTDTKVALATRSVKGGKNEGVYRFKETLDGTITYPKYEPVFMVAGAEYKSGSKVYLKEGNHDMTVYVSNKTIGAKQMPSVDGLEWFLEGDQWIGKMASAKSATIGNESIEIVVDTEAPKITNVVGFIAANNTATVKFDVESLSGVKSVMLNGEAVTPAVSGNTYTLSGLDLKAGAKVEIEVTSMAGLTGKGAGVIADALAFHHELVNATPIEGAEGYVYLNGEAYVEVTLAGAEVNGTPGVASVIENISGVDSDVTGTAAGKWTKIYELGTTGNTPGVTLTAYDDQGRSVGPFAVPSYLVDNAAPTYEITAQEEGKTEPSATTLNTNKTTTVTVTVTDNVQMPAVAGDDYVIFNVNGVDNKVSFEKINDRQYQASIVLTGEPEEQRLTGITSTVSDSAGFALNINEEINVAVDKTAPELEAYIEGAEKLLVTQDGRLFAILTPVADLETGSPDTATMYYDFSDFVDGVKTKVEVVTLTVDKNSTLGAEFSIPAEDSLGNHGTTLDIAVKTETGLDSVYTLTYDAATKSYKGMIYADRRVPGSSADDSTMPFVTIDSNNATENAGKMDLYPGSLLTFTTTITDVNPTANADPNADSGIKEIRWAVEDGGKNYLSLVKDDSIMTDGEFVKYEAGTYQVQIQAGANETRDAKLFVEVTDKAGNTYTYAYSFAHDNLAPRVTVTKSGKGSYVGDMEYIKEAMTYSVTVEDMFLDMTNSSIQAFGNNALFKNNSETYTITVDKELKHADSEKSIVITAVDLSGNKPVTSDNVHENFTLADGVFKNNNHVIFDAAAPVVKVTANGEIAQAVSEVDYYKTDVVYSFTVTDEHLSNVKDGSAVLTISYYFDNGEEAVETVSLPAAEADDKQEDGKLEWKKDGEIDTYTYSFTMSDEEKVLTDIKIAVQDNAGNSFTLAQDSLKFATDIQKPWEGYYAGNDVIVDKTAPKVTVKRANEENKAVTAKNTVNDIAYFGENVTYIITVEEANLNPASVVTLTGDYLGAETTLNFDKQGEQDEHKVEFTLTDPMKLDNIQIDVVDYAGWKPAAKESNPAITVIDTDEVYEEYNNNGGYKWTDESKSIIIDTTDPIAKLTITSTNKDVLDQFVTHRVQKENSTEFDEYYYLKLKDPAEDTDKPVKITATLTVTDRNLLDVEGFLVNNKGTSSKHEGWTLNGIDVNSATAEVSFTTDVEVAYNNTGMVALDLNIKDAVNRALGKITVDPVQNTTLSTGAGVDLKGSVFRLEGENVKSNIVLDRRRPTSDKDSDIPSIVIAATTAPAYRTANDVPLYNEVPSFYVNVQDRGKEIDADYLNAGLDYVSVVLTKAGQMYGDELIFNNIYEDYENTTGVYENKTKDIKFENAANAKSECNECVLTVTAREKVHNDISSNSATLSETIVSRVFAVDTLAPRIDVTYDYNEASNDLYFNKDRVATIEVTDINFNPNTTPVNTQVEVIGWAANETKDVHTATCIYNTDGDYTFSMSSKDLAENETTDEGVKYDGTAPQKFTIDKTNPVISVVYNPLHNKEVKDHRYYNAKTTATVIIDEHNFRASDVAPVFRKDGNHANYIKLGNFTSAEDTHKASAQFADGNNYDFTVTYSDLAGNPAEPYNSGMFSVDSKKPVIEITRGEMTNEELNVVSGDVVLQFRITDEEKNLDGYTVKVTHLNNEFETIVVSGSDYYTIDEQDDGNTVYVNMTNILKDKLNDGIYTVEIVGIDRAGNEQELAPPLVFSLNRFGSTFTTDDSYTKQFLKLGEDGITYHKSVDDRLIVEEINPNRVYHKQGDKQVEGSMLTVVANGVSRQLEEGKDYTMSVKQNKSKDNKEIQTWYIYTYEINPSVFQNEDDFVSGRYSILFYSEDEAGNKNTNESNAYSALQLTENGEYTGKMEFVLDNMPPVITTTGIESGKVYNTAFQRMEIIISDTTPAGIQVFLNGTEVVLSDNALADNVAWLVQDAVTGNYMLNVPEQNELFGSQHVSIVAKDAAGNAAESLVEDFNVTTSLLVRVLNNGWLIGGGITGIIALILFILMKKKKA